MINYYSENIAKNKYCSICHSKNIEYQEIKNPKLLPNQPPILTLKVCLACGHAAHAENKDLNTNLLIQQDIFDGKVSKPGECHTRWPHRASLVASEIERITEKTHGKILDIGCNNGVWLSALNNSWEKYGVELSERAAEVARKFAKAQVYCGSIESFNAKHNSFDVITAFALIEHISDPRRLIKWCYEHLKPEGLLVIMTGDRESWTAQQLAENWPLYWPIEHVSFFSARSLCSLLKDSGFRVIRKEWRFMHAISRKVSLISRSIIKTKEVLRMVDKPIYDLFYCYAKKP